MKECVIVQVDDDENDCFLFARPLKKAGFLGEYVSFPNLAQARAYIDEKPDIQPFVCLCDGSIGSLQEMAAFIRSLPKTCVAIAYSGTDSPTVRKVLLNAGAREFIAKPNSFELAQEIAEQVIRLCALAEEERQRLGKGLKVE